jgi:hypothetical protein
MKIHGAIAKILSDFSRLCLAQSSRTFAAVRLLPPFENGMWRSKWRFLVEPHWMHWPPSRRQTSTFTAVGIKRLCGSSTPRPNDFFSTGLSENLKTSFPIGDDVRIDQLEETL